MRDKRTAMAVLLSLFAVLVYSELVLAPMSREAQQAAEQKRENAAEQQATNNAPGTAANNTVAPQGTNSQTTPSQQSGTQTAPEDNQRASLGNNQATGFPSIADVSAKGFYTVETPLYRIQLSQLGAALYSFKLNNYRDHFGDEELLDLVKRYEVSPLPLSLHGGGFSDAAVEYRLVGFTDGTSSDEKNFQLDSQPELRLKFEGQFPSGATVTKIFTFRSNSYLFEVASTLSAPLADASPFSMRWTSYIETAELEDTQNPLMITKLNFKDNIERQSLIEAAAQSEPESLQWLALGDKYFMHAILSTEGAAKATFRANKNYYNAEFRGDSQTASFSIYAGPKSYRTLQNLPYSLERSIDFGIFAFLAQPLLLALVLFNQGFLGIPGIGNYGLSIIFLTLIIKALFLPLTKVSMRSMKAMQDLQPEIQALRERVSDPTQLNQEMMALYKKRGVNPLGGCFPMLIQIPVFLGLYMALLNAVELRHEPFALWITDLSTPEALEILGIPVPVMVLLMGLSMFVQQWTTPSAMDPTQKKVMMFMPVMFTVMFVIFPFPAGLVLYWLVNNLISIVQQAYLRQEKDASPMKATALASALIFGIGYALTLIS